MEVYMSSTLKKQQYVENFIKSFAAVETQMEPYKEHKRDLKKEYVENSWLTREELSMAVKAYRMLKNDDDLEKFNEIFEQVSKSIGG